VGGKGGGGGEEMTQALYAHMNNKTILKMCDFSFSLSLFSFCGAGTQSLNVTNLQYANVPPTSC
jgi:hypothetical protein